jgi:hypothetical protein
VVDDVLYLGALIVARVVGSALVVAVVVDLGPLHLRLRPRQVISVSVPSKLRFHDPHRKHTA